VDAIVAEELRKRYKTVQALNGVSFSVREGEVFGLLGPNGAGKSTTVRSLATLTRPDSGSATVAGEDVLRHPNRVRSKIGYVAQDSGVDWEATARENLLLQGRIHAMAGKPLRMRVDELLELVGLDEADAKRYPSQLSGGQRQRVGLARALAADPPLLLMDEPFGALDPITRFRLQTELRRLQREVEKTVIFVTHDIDEAIQMGDRIAILREGGVLAQYDSPDAILAHPADDFVAKFIGEDRALRRLALKTVGELPLQVPRTAFAVPDTWVTPDTTLRNAVSLMLELKTDELAVKDGDRVIGVFHLRDVNRLL
jgi:osmoprotectant transport system ATP-binding protein